MTKDIYSDLRGADEKFEAGFLNRDAQAIADTYTFDAMLLPAGTDFINGKKAIGEFWQSVIDSGVDQAKLNILEAEDYGDTATSTGEYILLGKSMQLDKGKYIVIWKQQEGQWKLHRDIWTTSLNSVT